MKKILFLSFISFSFISAIAQTLPEGFEAAYNYFAKNQLGQNITSVQLTTAPNWRGVDSVIVSFGKSFNPGGTFNKQNFKVAGHSGSNAMQIMTRFQDSIISGIGGENLSGVITNGTFDISTGTPTIIGGMPFSGKLAGFSVWVKADLKGSDNAQLSATLIDDADGLEEVVANADSFITTNINTWTKITIPFKYIDTGITPTLLRFTFGTGNLDTTLIVTDSTSISIDDIEINFPTGTSSYIFSSGMAKVYPNPCSTFLNIDVPAEKLYTILLFDIKGQLVLNKFLDNKLNTIDLQLINDGIYQYQIINTYKLVVQSDKILLVK